MIIDRRSVMAGLALVAATPAMSLAQTKAQMAETSGMSFAEVKTAMQFYTAVLPRAELSLATSQTGVERTTRKDANEFAGFELGEAVTVNMVLKDLGATAPAMDADATATLEKINKAAKGEAFDRAYIAFQLANHEYLRDLADAYLHNTAGSGDPAEKQGRHLASLMLAVFKEHTAICKRIGSELKA